MPRKLISFHDEDRRAIEELADDKSSTFQELIDEAVRGLLKKHGRPTGLRDALKASADDTNVVPLGKRAKKPTR